MSVTHHLSPELVLVDPDLRAAAIASLPERSWETFGRSRERSPQQSVAEYVRGPSGSLIAGAVLYAAWHALLGAVFVLGAVLTVALVFLAVGFATG